MALEPSAKYYIAGHRGMVGAALVRALKERGCENLLLPTRDEVDLTQQTQVQSYIEKNKPEVMVVAAAKVGGIYANNTYPAEFIYENLMIACNTIHAAYQAGVKRLLFLGSSCIYPREAPQPMSESCLLTGPLELTNEAYAVAKIAGLKLCQYYRKQYGVMFHSAMPTNLYGPGDNYHGQHSHVIPALIKRFHESKMAKAEEIKIWGSGRPRREFLHVDDLAQGCLHLLGLESPPDWVNLGYGEDISIAELAQSIQATVAYEGRLVYDISQPDGTMRKLMDNQVMFATGWCPQIALEEGLKGAYQDFLKGNVRQS
jgi:GDP-L-fucose synthase